MANCYEWEKALKIDQGVYVLRISFAHILNLSYPNSGEKWPFRFVFIIAFKSLCSQYIIFY